MKPTKIILMVLLIIIVLAPTVFADNPIVQTIYTADPAPMVYNDTLYVYTGHDEPNSTYFTMYDYRVFSTTDMVNWTDHGAVLATADFAWAKEGEAWAAQCIERNGKFYYYITATSKTLNRPTVAVAVADSPTGPFVDPLGHPLIANAWGDIDPTVFIDDDGQAYLYWGNPNLWYVKLNEDMISYDKSVGVVKVPLTEEGFGKRHGNPERATLYEEGPWLYKRDGLYYMIYAASGIPENIAYSTSTSPTGPWKFQGIIMPTEGRSFTNHPGVIDYEGKSYFFYHNGALPGGGGFTRSVCVEEFQFNPDGSFPTIRMSKQGPEAIANLDPYKRNEAETIAWSSGVKTEPHQDGGINVSDINDGDYIKVKSVDFGKLGAGSFTASVASGSKGGAIELRLDSLSGPIIGTLPVSYTGGWDVWQTKTTNIFDATGIRDLFFIFKGNDKELFKFDFWSFEEKGNSSIPVAINASIDNYKIDTKPQWNTAKMRIYVIYADGTSKDITNEAKIAVDDGSIVNVSDGIVYGINYGQTDISVSYSGKSDKLSLLVKDLESELTVKRLISNKNDVTMHVGSATPFDVTAEYVDGRKVDVTNSAVYKNSNPKVASIVNGNIAGKSAGEAEVVVSYQGELGEAATTKVTIAVLNRNPFVKNEAEFMTEQRGVDTENCSEGGQNVGFIENGDWIMFSGVDFNSGASSFDARVASATSGGTIELRLGSPDGMLIGTMGIGNTGGWQSWTTPTVPVEEVTGVHDLYLVFTGGSGYLFNINWWQFNPKK